MYIDISVNVQLFYSSL